MSSRSGQGTLHTWHFLDATERNQSCTSPREFVSRDDPGSYCLQAALIKVMSPEGTHTDLQMTPCLSLGFLTRRMALSIMALLQGGHEEGMTQSGWQAGSLDSARCSEEGLGARGLATVGSFPSHVCSG